MSVMTRIICLITFCVYLLGLLGCTTAYVSNISGKALSDVRLKSHFAVERNAEWLVHANTPIFLAQPIDIKSKHRHRHIFRLYRSLDFTLQQTFPAYATNQGDQNLSKIFEVAVNNGSELLFLPKLVTTENNLSSRQEIIEGNSLHPNQNVGADKAVFQVLIYEVRTKKLIDIATVSGRSHIFSSSIQLPLDLFQQAAFYFTHAITGKNLG